MEVRDGGTSASPLIGSRMCGYNIPQTIVSSGNLLFVQFHTDSSVARSGFKIRFDIGKLQIKRLYDQQVID